MRYPVPVNPLVPVMADTLCDAGADTLRGATRPAAWIPTAIQSVSNAAGNGPCTPGPDGTMLHWLWEFSAPALQRDGKRRRPVGEWRPTDPTGKLYPPNSAIRVESDACPKTWAGTAATAYLVGGFAGDIYEITLNENVPRDETDDDRIFDVPEPEFPVELTRYVFSTGDTMWVNFPSMTPYHRIFWLVQGAARLVGPGGLFLPLDNAAPFAPRIPLSAPQIQVQAGIYRTEGTV